MAKRKAKRKTKKRASKKRATKKRGTARRHTAKKRSKKRKSSSSSVGAFMQAANRRGRGAASHNLMPEKVIARHAQTLKRNPRALRIYREVLGC